MEWKLVKNRNDLWKSNSGYSILYSPTNGLFYTIDLDGRDACDHPFDSLAAAKQYCEGLASIQSPKAFLASLGLGFSAHEIDDILKRAKSIPRMVAVKPGVSWEDAVICGGQGTEDMDGGARTPRDKVLDGIIGDIVSTPKFVPPRLSASDVNAQQDIIDVVREFIASACGYAKGTRVLQSRDSIMEYLTAFAEQHRTLKAQVGALDDSLAKRIIERDDLRKEVAMLRGRETTAEQTIAKLRQEIYDRDHKLPFSNILH